MVTGSVREFLTKHRLVERLDKTCDLKVKGNGYVISAKGRALLETLPCARLKHPSIAR